MPCIYGRIKICLQYLFPMVFYIQSPFFDPGNLGDFLLSFNETKGILYNVKGNGTVKSKALCIL